MHLPRLHFIFFEQANSLEQSGEGIGKYATRFKVACSKPHRV